MDEKKKIQSKNQYMYLVAVHMCSLRYFFLFVSTIAMRKERNVQERNISQTIEHFVGYWAQGAMD